MSNNSLNINLVNSGFTTFNLKDYNVDLYNKLRENILYKKTSNVLDVYLCNFFFCATIPITVYQFFEKIEKIFLDIDYDITHQDYLRQKEVALKQSYTGNEYYIRMAFPSNDLSILKQIKEIIFSNFEFNQDQSWFESGPFVPNELNTSNFQESIKHIIHTILQNHYPDNISRYFEKNNYVTKISCFPKQSWILPHRDGENDERLAVILIYLNDDWKPEYGGQLVLEKNTLVQPEFGNVAILDFTKNNVHHEVLEVLDDKFRYTFISFLDIRNM